MQQKIYMIAGEASGDQLGGMLVQEMRTLSDTIDYRGIGGFCMMQQGIASRFPMRELSIMGFAEILPHILRLKLRIRQTVEDIEAFKPDILLTIDSPGFNFRVVKLLRARGIHLPRCIHYVAPTVWAYKPERALTTAALFDHLLCLLPFEPELFTTHGLKADDVGHPMAWWWRSKAHGESFRSRHHIHPEAKLVACFPGSRMGEITRHLPIIREAMVKLSATTPQLHSTIYIREDIAKEVYALTRNWPCPLTLCDDQTQKKQLFAAADAAIAKSGTISLECALAGLPSLTIYRTSALSAWYVRRKLRTKFVHLANILSGSMIVPELIQADCTAEKIAAGIHQLLSDEVVRHQQINALSSISEMLGTSHDISPSMRAADIILGYLRTTPDASRSPSEGEVTLIAKQA